MGKQLFFGRILIFANIFFALHCAEAIGDEEAISLVPVLLRTALSSRDVIHIANRDDQLPSVFEGLGPTTSPYLHIYHDGETCGYLFYNQVDISHPTASYLCQRVKRTVRDYVGDQLVEEKVDYLVEAIRLDNDRLKAADKHFGLFQIRDLSRREIQKEFEIGTLIESHEQPDLFGGKIYRLIHDYQPSSTEYSEVRFAKSVKWTLTLDFDVAGNSKIVVPELGLRSETQVPELSRPIETVTGTNNVEVARAGIGLRDVVVRKSTLDQATRVLGSPEDVFPQKNGARNVLFPGGLLCHVGQDEVIKTISLVAGFTGYVDVNGVHVQLGDDRERIIDKLGKSMNSKPNRQCLTYKGIAIWFEGEKATKLVIW